MVEPAYMLVGGMIALMAFLVGRLTKQPETGRAEAQRKLAYKENGKLSRIIGHQRFAIAELKAKLAQFQPTLSNAERRARYEASRKTEQRPSLPH